MEASESNKKILERLKNLLKKVILPRLDDQTVLTFGCTCKQAHKLATDIISSRGIVLREEKPADVEQAVITVSIDTGDSYELTEKETLESGLLCTKRYRNLKNHNGDVSFTHHMEEMNRKSLKRIIEFVKVTSSKDLDEIEKWAVANLDEASTKRLIKTIKAAEELKIEGILLRSIKYMEGRIKGKTAHQMRVIFRFATKDSEEKPGYNYNGDYNVDEYDEKKFLKEIQRMRHFLELMIPSLDDETYLCFASMNKSCAKLLNDVQSRKFFRPGNLEEGQWKISISCCDGKSLEATKDLMCFSGLIKNIQIDHPYEEKMNIQLNSTTSCVLSVIIKFCSEHGKAYLPKASLMKFDSEFVQSNKHRLLDLAQAAETLKIRSLLDVVAPKIVSMIHHKQVNEIRATFGLKYDFLGRFSKETDWWGTLEYFASRRTKTNKNIKQLIPWQEVEDVPVEGFGPEPSHSGSEEIQNSDDSEKSEDSESDGSEEEEENVDYVFAVEKDPTDEKFWKNETSEKSAAEKPHIGLEPSHYGSEEVQNSGDSEKSEGSESDGSEEEEENVDVDKVLSDEEFGEDEESHKSAESDVVPAEKLQNGFFYFCEGFRTSHIKSLTDDWHGHDSSKLIADLNALNGKTGVELWKSLPTKVGIAAARKWFRLSKDERTTYLEKFEEAQKEQRENQLSIMKLDESAESDEGLMKAYKKKLEEAAKAEQEMEEAAKDLKSAFFFFCEEFYPTLLNTVELPSETIKDNAHFHWKNSEVMGLDRAPYVEKAKKSRVEYHEKAMTKKNLAGASGPSTSKEDLEMDAYIKNWDEAAKAQERKIKEQMEAYKKKLENGEEEAYESDVFVESGIIRLPDKTIFTRDGIEHDPPCGYTFFTKMFMKDYKEQFPDHTSERANRLADEQWDKLSAVERANYLDMSQKQQDLDVKTSLA